VRIRVLGAYGGAMPGCSPCGFLIDGTVLLEAGTAASVLTLEEQRRIRHILVSHIHLEHVQALAYLAENLFTPEGRPPIHIVALPKVVKALKADFFNGRIWPDFTRIPTPERPVFNCRPIPEGETAAVGHLTVRGFAVNHPVASAGFLIGRGRASFVFSGDTGRTDALWTAAGNDPRLRAAFIEASFPDEMAALAEETGHLVPRQVRTEFEKLGRRHLPVYAYHMKPRFLAQLRAQLGALGLKRLTVLEDGMELTI
jgi:ribonuclease BN (tRNA processing enzyme)